jgi:hypothetical protein
MLNEEFIEKNYRKAPSQMSQSFDLIILTLKYCSIGVNKKPFIYPPLLIIFSFPVVDVNHPVKIVYLRKNHYMQAKQRNLLKVLYC